MGKPSEKESKGSPGYITSHGLIGNDVTEEDEQFFPMRANHGIAWCSQLSSGWRSVHLALYL